MSRKIAGTCLCTGSPRKCSVELNGEVIDARIRALTEASGHFGPWCDKEFVNAGVIVVIPPTSEPEPDKPEEVVEAEQRVATAQAGFDLAEGEWQAAARAAYEERRKAAGGDWVTTDGQPIDDGGRTSRKIRKLDDAAAELWERRDDAGEVLRKARVKEHAALVTWEREQRAARAAAR